MIYRTSTLVMCGGLMALILFSFALDRWYNPFYTGYWQAVASQSWLSFFIMVMAVILAGRIIADEFQWGTIKFLLIRPAGRSRILFVKYGAVLCFCFFLLMVLFLCSMILTGSSNRRGWPIHPYRRKKKTETEALWGWF